MKSIYMLTKEEGQNENIFRRIIDLMRVRTREMAEGQVGSQISMRPHDQCPLRPSPPAPRGRYHIYYSQDIRAHMCRSYSSNTVRI